MTLVLPLGLAVVFNAGVLGVGIFWIKRQAKRVAVERVTEHRGMYWSEPLPMAAPRC